MNKVHYIFQLLVFQSNDKIPNKAFDVPYIMKHLMYHLMYHTGILFAVLSEGWVLRMYLSLGTLEPNSWD